MAKKYLAATKIKVDGREIEVDDPVEGLTTEQMAELWEAGALKEDTAATRSSDAPTESSLKGSQTPSSSTERSSADEATSTSSGGTKSSEGGGTKGGTGAP
jgi:hypothetical protein